MNRLDRLSAILVQLQSRSFVKAQQIADRFEVSLRTVYRDIQALEEAGVPVAGNPGIGYSLVEGFKLPPLMFTQEEALAFLTAEKLVHELTDRGSSGHYKSGMDKIRAVMRYADKEVLESMEANVDVLKTYKSETSGSGNVLQSLLQVIHRKRVLRIVYFSDSKQEVSGRYIEPVGLFFSKTNWYLIAFCQARKEYRTFRVDRIKSFIELDSEYTRVHPALEKFLKDFHQKQGLEEVVLQFKKENISVIGDDKYYYGLFSEKEVGDSIECYFLTFSLEKFARWYLSFADWALIVSPPKLKDKVRSIIRNITL